jgi:hypothetical protein
VAADRVAEQLIEERWYESSFVYWTVLIAVGATGFWRRNLWAIGAFGACFGYAAGAGSESGQRIRRAVLPLGSVGRVRRTKSWSVVVMRLLRFIELTPGSEPTLTAHRSNPPHV